MPTISEEIMDPKALKEEGNQHFKNGNFVEALGCYTKALEVCDIKDADKAVILKNRSACHLKQDDYQSAADDASASLEIVPNDPKSLYRRCQAYEHLGKVEEAYKDAAALMTVDPKNKAVQPILKRLNPIIQDRAKEQNSTASKVSQMFNLAFDPNGEKDKRLQAVNNLVVLAREEAGAKFIVEQSGIDRLNELLDSKDVDIVQAGVRVLSCLSNNSKPRCLLIESQIGIPKICLLIGCQSDDVSTSAAHLLQNLITYISELNKYEEAMKVYNEMRRQGDPARHPKFEQDEDQKNFISRTFNLLIKMLQNPKVSAYGRDNAMELLMKNVTRKDGVQWTKQFLDTDGLEGLLTVAGAVKQHKTLPVTEHSKQHASVALSRIYDDLMSDKERDKFRDKCQDFFKDLFADDIFESKVEAVKAISTLLQGPYDVGSVMLSFEGVTQIMFALAKSDTLYHQQVAVEAIVHSASKKDKCAGILSDAVPILKKLFKEGEDSIKVRALVGLCKLGSYGGSDASTKPMAEGSTLTLAKACRKFLTNPSKDIDLRRWATEGLAFLTLDAEVKEELINDTAALKSLIDVAARAEKNILYPALTVFVNLTNSYDKPDIMPEMIELAKFSKQHVPEEHEKDKPEVVKERVHKLAKNNVVSAMVTLSKTESNNSREQLSRVYLALATEEDLRGLIIQQGGGKSLVQLALDKNTDAGMINAAQALAKLTITMNPQTAFPGQRVYEVVRPLLMLLHIDRTALQNFEALLALTNLASMSDSLRKRIISEKGIPKIEHYMYEEHEMLRRASTECLCNMMMNEEYTKRFLEENDLVKLWTLYCGEADDPLLVRAASGGLAMLTNNPKICKKVLDVKPWYEILLSLAVNENVEIQHRGCYIISNMISAGKEMAEKMIEGQMLEVLMALSILQEPERAKAKQLVTEALEKALEYGLIQPSQTAPKVDIQTAPKSNNQTALKSDTKTAPMSDTETTTKSDTQIAPKSDTQTPPMSDSQTTPKSDSQTDPDTQTAPSSDAEVAPKSDS